jgi:GNAT superfamily N-acetyltransferase
VRRHPTRTDWPEIARVLTPGGTYFSQQIGAGTNIELAHFFEGLWEMPDEWRTEYRVRQAKAAGLDVVDVREASLDLVFYDVAAVIVFLRKVIWTVSDFSVDRYRDWLAGMHRRIQHARTTIPDRGAQARLASSVDAIHGAPRRRPSGYRRAIMEEIADRTPEDLARCVSVLAAVHTGSGYPSNWPSDPERWLSPSGMIAAWVAVRGPDVLGHALIRESSAGEVEFGRLFVGPQARGRGIATSLLEHAVVWAVDRAMRLTLEVNADLAPAIRLYERAGWRRVDTYVAGWTGVGGETVTIHRYAYP